MDADGFCSYITSVSGPTAFFIASKMVVPVMNIVNYKVVVLKFKFSGHNLNFFGKKKKLKIESKMNTHDLDLTGISITHASILHPDIRLHTQKLTRTAHNQAKNVDVADNFCSS